MLQLKSSVGRGGTNNPSDVTALQKLISEVIPEINLKPDGIAGKRTYAAIDYFQGRYVGITITGLIKEQDPSLIILEKMKSSSWRPTDSLRLPERTGTNSITSP